YKRQAHGRGEAESSDYNHELRHDPEEVGNHEQMIFDHSAILRRQLARLYLEAGGGQLGAQALYEVEL
ncbi:hypothetical protein, partial [Salmonella enterica]|uniref:hypothetical protein n=1 Tax=Salmonella enterica TaxID=28901 RepID=UPI003F4C6527